VQISIAEFRAMIDVALERSLPVSALAGNEALNGAIRCAVYPGGKRVRPLFTLLAAQAAGVSAVAALHAACAVELLHSSSLVFDDLPCMDDADLRRNRPAVHLLFGESLALLAGLALLNQAYALFARSNPRLVQEAARCIGVNGMIGGQSADLNGSELEPRDCKTSALMRLTLTAGAQAGGASVSSVALLAECGERLGRAYQMLDDLNDACCDSGKTVAQDQRHHRPAWNVSRDAVLAEVAGCRQLLTNSFGSAAEPLASVIDVVFTRMAGTGLVAA
jgi:geranylgeranyl diphosphate synthase type II